MAAAFAAEREVWARVRRVGVGGERGKLVDKGVANSDAEVIIVGLK